MGRRSSVGRSVGRDNLEKLSSNVNKGNEDEGGKEEEEDDESKEWNR